MNLVKKWSLGAFFFGAAMASVADSHADQRWGELSLGTASGYGYKWVTDGRGWGVSLIVYDDLEIFGDGHYDRSTNKKIDESSGEFGVVRVFSHPGGHSFRNVAVGLGYAKKIDATHCVKNSSSYFESYACDREEKSGIVIPVEANIAFGKYAGFGIKLKASIGAVNSAGVGILIPLGKFTQ